MYNGSQGASFADFSEVDLFVRYTASLGDVSLKRLTHSSEWRVASISGDAVNPKVWDPGETATIAFSLDQEPQTADKGTVSITVPGGSSDSAYFQPEICRQCWWHNNPTPPVGDTASQLLLNMTTSPPTATTLYNYDTDRDTVAGLLILKGGSGPGETDPTLYQAWKTTTLSSPVSIEGDVTIDFWSALKAFKQSSAGRITFYLRDYDDVGGYTEIANQTLFDNDWQGGSSSFVNKTATLSSVSYTVPPTHQLELKVIVKSGSDDMWFAYDTETYASVLKLPE